ncbi:ABC transporter ATP-binding protein [Agrobacterium tumefaciens]|uniref:ABC transporter ATP-binding protein n=1 Tax=Agrobacterium tumefaciens TaxID=358 RepID=A0AA44EZL6_AGRTU|nr:ABC transporter ATP-binding protein [Agrobacterium tumefaciens]NSL23098.1 ABC transporter ATP-binding protein [Agrobacterium tumefaciens]NTB89685.1 ABC transporter ATP-binding protein [Agrobacterium tumefaciens]NTC15515.1 ABC transporter ATP-binding protein [Agrobacterium tumefaciens]NTC26599.1 ABC transporter ATP-binding protein [Agrobacterium tumefaciens]NTC58119.1 ABC transporter ATP-binding protein [Agrobacterium tumefaciens]
MVATSSQAKTPEYSSNASLVGSRLSFVAGGRKILDEVSCEILAGKTTALVGPNGSGKSSLMRLLVRLEVPTTGHVALSGCDVTSFSRRDFARRLAFLPQDMQPPTALSVRDLVACGRHPHRAIWRPETKRDGEIIEEALAVTDLADLSSRPVGALSGGERQRALIAMALAQETQILMLDEPTTYLDLRYQIQILELVRRLQAERQLTVCWVLHDLNEAAAYSDEVIVLSKGRCIATGSPEHVLTPVFIRDVFGIDMLRLAHPADGGPLLVPSRGWSPNHSRETT